MRTHIFVSNSFGYAKAENQEDALKLLEPKVFPNNPDKEIPVTIIVVYEPITKAYAINSFLPEKVEMMLIQQDYESNCPIGERCMLDNGILYFGKAL
jgi:hypothetical protein